MWPRMAVSIWALRTPAGNPAVSGAAEIVRAAESRLGRLAYLGQRACRGRKIARPRVAAGSPLHSRDGEISAPSQVCNLGMRPPSAKAGEGQLERHAKS